MLNPTSQDLLITDAIPPLPVLNDWVPLGGDAPTLYAQGGAFVAMISNYHFENVGILPVDLGTLGGDESYALAVNASGQIVGSSKTAFGDWHAFIITPTDSNGDLMPDIWHADQNLDGVNDLMYDIGAVIGSFKSTAFAINDSGEIVGLSIDPNNKGHAFFSSADYGFQDLGALDASYSTSAAFDINEQIMSWVGAFGHRLRGWGRDTDSLSSPWTETRTEIPTLGSQISIMTGSTT